jgi:biofilm PGA synthesis N-glycosyltransferase PgaC
MIEKIRVLLPIVSLTLFIIGLFISSIFAYKDSKLKRKLKHYPDISCIIPTYNDGKYLEKTIESLYKSYDKRKMEVLVVNDASTDNTSNILKKLLKKYPIKVITNKENKGKVVSINENFHKAKKEIVIIVDSDMVIRKEAIEDLLARFENNENVGGVSCRYKVMNRKGFLTKMQDIEYNMMGLIDSASNHFSTISLWGGFMAFRKEAFRDIKSLSINALTEDIDAALKLKEAGWKAEQSNEFNYTIVPDNFRCFYKQKIRWGAGFMQNLINHSKAYIKNPLTAVMLLSYIIFGASIVLFLITDFYTVNSISDVILFIKSLQETFAEKGYFIWRGIIFAAIFSLSTIPPMIYDKEYRTNFKKYFLIFPYTILYYPIYSVISVIGFIKLLIKYRKLKKGARGW